MIANRSVWRMRVGGELPRYLLYLTMFAGLAASARFVIAPPSANSSVRVEQGQLEPEPAAEAYAVLFARHYLTWNASEPQDSTQALEQFVGPGMESGVGVVLPTSGEQKVEWAEVVQVREPEAGEHVYTVAAQTDTAGLMYLTVPVERTPAGGLALSGYPAFVGAPAAEGARIDDHLREVSESSLATVVKRALRNYLGSSEAELAADLAVGARVSLPSRPLALESLQHLQWAPVGSAVLATVEAQDARGARYTLAYELNVIRAQGRWEIQAIEMDPDA